MEHGQIGRHGLLVARLVTREDDGFAPTHRLVVRDNIALGLILKVETALRSCAQVKCTDM